MNTKKKVIVIGSGLSSLSAACYLAKSGYQITVLEKNNQIGGRLRTWQKDGFTFDMGPSWYWMPDVFEQFFADFGKKPSDYYNLVRLDPGYRVFFGQNQTDLPAKINDIYNLFEDLEANGQIKLENFLAQAKYTYDKGVNDYMRRPSDSIFEFANLEFISGIIKAGIFRSYGRNIGRQFESQAAREILNFPVLFLGSTPDNTPYLYSLMAYAQIVGGTWYPMGGMVQIPRAVENLARELGVEFLTKHNVTRIEVKDDKASKVLTDQGEFETDFVVGGADYHHLEQNLLPKQYRRYNEKYWNSRTLSPSSLLFYLGVKGKINNLQHHNLFFETDFNHHAKQIYYQPQWPDKPLFYVCAPSKTDPTVAPEGMENLFLLMPLAPGLEDSEEMRQKYFEIMLERLEHKTGQKIRDSIVVQKSYCLRDFEADYNSYKGNAYGLANTLFQTAVFKPKYRSKLPNLFFCGQLTLPGPGLPPALISGQIAANAVINS
jgi:phytoene desaturase